MHDWVSGLFALRAANPALQTGAQQDLLVDDTGFAFARIPNSSTATAIGDSLLTMLNKADTSRDFDLNFVDTALSGARSLVPVWNANGTIAVRENHCRIQLRAEQMSIYRVVRQVTVDR